MKSVTVETLSGKTFFIENVGSCFMLHSVDAYDLGTFSSLQKAIEHALSLS
jgi:hypothetical protein